MHSMPKARPAATTLPARRRQGLLADWAPQPEIAAAVDLWMEHAKAMQAFVQLVLTGRGRYGQAIPANKQEGEALARFIEDAATAVKRRAKRDGIPMKLLELASLSTLATMDGRDGWVVD